MDQVSHRGPLKYISNRASSGNSHEEPSAAHAGGKENGKRVEGGQVTQMRLDADGAFSQLHEVGVRKIAMMVKEPANFHDSDFKELADSVKVFNGAEDKLGEQMEASHEKYVMRTGVDAMRDVCKNYVESASDPEKAYEDLRGVLLDLSNGSDGIKEAAVFSEMLSGFRESAIGSGRMQPGDYDAIKLRLNADCFANKIPEGARVDTLGSGQFCEVSKVTIPERDSVPESTVVVKAIMPEGSDNPSVQIGGIIIGGDSDKPLLAERNEAASRLDPFGVLVKSKVGYLMGGDGSGNRVIMMEMAQGKSVDGDLVPMSISEEDLQGEGAGPFDTLEDAKKYLSDWNADGEIDPDATVEVDGQQLRQYAIMKLIATRLGGVDLKVINGDVQVLTPTCHVLPFNNPDFRKQSVMLNYADALTMQMDRHKNNYLVQLKPDGSCVLKGIDNDACFPNTEEYNTENLTFDDYGGKRWRGTHLPLIADKEIYDSFCDPEKGMTEEKIQSQLEGLLPQEEIDATKARLALIQHHLRKLNDDGMVIGMNGCKLQWGSLDAAEKLCEMRDDTFTSYFGRDYDDVCRSIAGGVPGQDLFGNTVDFDKDGNPPDELLLAEVTELN